ncbi:MAG: DUF86 domain-containing protein [Bacillota bacterium]|nr:DUF86 domain-containing protein [Bacillota bacterium]
MRLEAKKYLYDISEAAGLIADFAAGKTLVDYQGDAMLRSAVERQFEIIGEALSQLARREESVAERITEYRRIIAFRNILAHGYTQIDARIVWDIVESKLPALRREVAALLSEG